MPSSMSAWSPSPHTPMVGAGMSGSRGGGSSSSTAARLARYQFERGGQRSGFAQCGDVALHVGTVRVALAELAPLMSRQQLLGHALELVEEHVPRTATLLDRRLVKYAGVSDGDRHEMVDPGGHERGERPRHRGTPVVTNHVGALDPDGSVERGQVAQDPRHAVVLDADRFARSTEAPQVGGDHGSPASASAGI